MRRSAFVVQAAVAALLLGWGCRADEAEDQFNFATGLLIKNEFALAAEEFQALLARHPRFGQADVARYRLGEALQKAGDTAAARAAFEQLLRDHPQSDRAPQAHYWLAQMLADDDPAAAAAHYGEVVARWPDSPLAEAAAYGVAEMRFKAGDWQAAVAACDELLRRFPAGRHAPHARYTRGWARWQAEQWAEALADFEEFVRQHPGHELAAECRLKAAECLHKLGRLDEALKAYDALAGDAGQAGRDAQTGRAYVLFAQGRMQEAAAAFQEAAQALAGDARRPACLLNAGHAWIAVTNYPQAMAVLELLRREHPHDALAPAATYWLAFARLKAGQAEAAAATLQQLQDDPALPDNLAVETRLLLAEAELQRGRPAAAAAAYKAAAALQPGHPLAAEAAAGEVFALEKAGDLPAAEAAAAAFIAAHPAGDRLPAMRFALGEYRFRQANHAGAAEAFDAFLKAHADHPLAPEAFYKLGWCARHANQPAEARRHFETVVRQYPQSPPAAESALRAGQACEELQDTAGAAENYAAAVKLGGEGEFARQGLLALAALKIAAGDAEAALASAEEFARRFPADRLLPFANLYRGEALLRLERFEEALKAYESVGAEEASAATDATFGRAWCLRKLGRPGEAAALFDQAATGKGARAAEAAFLAARCREEAGDFAAARDGYRALANDSARPAARRDEAAYRQALCAWRAGEREEAASGYAALAAARPESAFAAQALYDLAWVLLEQKKTADAEGRFQELLQRFPAHELAPDVHFRLGELAYDRGDFAAAAAAYERALQTAGLAFADKVLYKLGWTREHLGRDAEALETFARLAGKHPGSELAPEARYRQGRLLHKAGRHDEALAVLAPVTEGAFAERAALLAAECQRAAGRHREALAAYEQVLGKWPDGECRPAALLGRGHAQRAVGAFQDALDSYAAVIAAAPDSEEAAQATLGQGHAFFAMGNWTEAAKAFLKVDILYGCENLKPEALEMLAATWEKAGDAEKAARYRAERARRYPEAAKEP